MKQTFGNMILSVNQIVDGKTLSYGYSNRQISEKLRKFQTEFHLRFSRWLTVMSNNQEDENNDLAFLNLCIENMENIAMGNLDWYD